MKYLKFVLAAAGVGALGFIAWWLYQIGWLLWMMYTTGH
jgi:hypothetical protein